MLQIHAEKPAIVMAHHPIDPSVIEGRRKRDFSSLKDSGALYEMLRSRRQVKAYFYGHTHEWRIQRSEEGLLFVNLPPAGYVFDRREPSGWVIADLTPDGMNLELRAFDGRHPDHARRQFLKWRF